MSGVGGSLWRLTNIVSIVDHELVELVEHKFSSYPLANKCGVTWPTSFGNSLPKEQILALGLFTYLFFHSHDAMPFCTSTQQISKAFQKNWFF